MNRFRAAVVVVAILALVSGCGTTSQQPSISLTSGDDYSVAGALAEIPAEVAVDQVHVVTSDVAAATVAGGLERPTDAQGLPQWVQILAGRPTDGKPSPVFVPWASALHIDRAAQFDEIRTELGWSVLEVDAFVELTAPPSNLLVVAGDVTVNSELPEVTEGVVTAGAGDELSIDLEDRTPARPLGVPVRMAQQDGRIVATPVTEHAEAWLSGPDETLADHALLAPIADVLDDADVYSAAVMSGHSMELDHESWSAEQREQVLDRVGDAIPAGPFSAVGVGWGIEEDHPVVTIAYLFDSPEAAAGAVAAFESVPQAESVVHGQPMASLITMHSVTAIESMVVVTASPAQDQSPAIFYDLLRQRDLPFVHQ